MKGKERLGLAERFLAILLFPVIAIGMFLVMNVIVLAMMVTFIYKLFFVNDIYYNVDKGEKKEDTGKRAEDSDTTTSDSK